MKKLYLLRHGKSSWQYNELSDFERPLNERGRRDVPFMARLIKNMEILPDLIISSPALRAYYTARIFATILEYPAHEILTSELIYEAGMTELFTVLRSIDDFKNSVLLAGHNPGLTSFCNTLSGDYIDNIPTCGFVSINLKVDSWKDVETDCGKLEFHEFPKKYFK